MFTNVFGDTLENDNLENKSQSDFRLLRQHGAKAIAITAMGIVTLHLFKYLCDGDGEFPTGGLVYNWLPNTRVEIFPDSSPLPTPLHDQIALTPLSQDLQCGKTGRNGRGASLTSARLSSPIGSPFLVDEESMALWSPVLKSRDNW